MRRLLRAIAATALAAVTVAAPAIASAAIPGTPDRSFGTDGFVFSQRVPGWVSDDAAGGDAYKGFRPLDDGTIQVRATSGCAMDCRNGVLIRFSANGRYTSSGLYYWSGNNDGPDPAPPQGVATLALGNGDLLATYGGPAGPSGPSSPPHLLRIIRTDDTVAGTTVIREVALPTIFTPWSVTPDGGVVGYANSVSYGIPAGNATPVLMRLGPDLAPDASFGSGGGAALPPEILRAGPVAATATSVRVAGWDGNALLHGLFDQHGALVRVTRVPVSSTSPEGAMASRLIISRGRSLVVGWSATPPGTVIAAFGPGGRLDRRFARAGLLRIREGGSVAVQRDGRIVVVGTVPPPRGTRAGARIELRRFTANGRPDPTLPVSSYRTRAWWFDTLDVAIDRRGRILVVAPLTTASWTSGALLARFHG